MAADSIFSHRIKVYSVNHYRPATAQRLKFLEEKGLSLLPITRPIEYDLEEEEDYEAEIEAQGGRDPTE